MTDKPIMQPGPDHPITIEANPSRVVVSVAGKTVADSQHALTLREADYAPVQYIPLADVDESLLEATDHASYCPFKGDASYYNVPAGAERSANAVWVYRAPYDAVAADQGPRRLLSRPRRLDRRTRAHGRMTDRSPSAARIGPGDSDRERGMAREPEPRAHARPT